MGRDAISAGDVTEWRTKVNIKWFTPDGERTHQPHLGQPGVGQWIDQQIPLWQKIDLLTNSSSTVLKVKPWLALGLHANTSAYACIGLRNILEKFPEPFRQRDIWTIEEMLPAGIALIVPCSELLWESRFLLFCLLTFLPLDQSWGNSLRTS